MTGQEIMLFFLIMETAIAFVFILFEVFKWYEFKEEVTQFIQKIDRKSK